MPSLSRPLKTGQTVSLSSEMGRILGEVQFQGHMQRVDRLASAKEFPSDGQPWPCDGRRFFPKLIPLLPTPLVHSQTSQSRSLLWEHPPLRNSCSLPRCRLGVSESF